MCAGAILLAVPAAWFVMGFWLQGFAYHIDLSWWIFAAAGLGAIILTLLTIGGQALKTAFANPADTLKTE